jgi:autoinducer 2-degrading protein
MAKLAIIATVEIKPGRVDEYLPLLMAHRARCLKEEPGTLEFEVLVPRNEETRVMLYELYADDAAFEMHRNGSSIKRVNEEAAEIVVKVSGIRCNLAE